MNLHHLKVFLAVAEAGSISAGAERLHISQPALSRSIQGLEAQVGAPLFLREGHGVVPTDLGRVLVGSARQITRLADDLHDRLLGSPGGIQQELMIGAGPYPAETIVSRAVAAFIDAHPRFKLRIEIRNWDELLPRLRNRELDLFVAEIRTLEQEADLQVEPLATSMRSRRCRAAIFRWSSRSSVPPTSCWPPACPASGRNWSAAK